MRIAALPHQRTEDIVRMIDDAEQEDDQGEKASTQCIKVTIFDNPFLPAAGRDAAIKSWKSAGDDVYRKRALGEMTLDTVMMYPSFHPDLHNAIRFLDGKDEEREAEGQQLRHDVQKILTLQMGTPPDDWCRYLVFDPGYTVGYVG